MNYFQSWLSGAADHSADMKVASAPFDRLCHHIQPQSQQWLKRVAGGDEYAVIIMQVKPVIERLACCDHDLGVSFLPSHRIRQRVDEWFNNDYSISYWIRFGLVLDNPHILLIIQLCKHLNSFNILKKLNAVKPQFHLQPLCILVLEPNTTHTKVLCLKMESWSWPEISAALSSC